MGSPVGTGGGMPPPPGGKSGFAPGAAMRQPDIMTAGPDGTRMPYTFTGGKTPFVPGVRPPDIMTAGADGTRMPYTYEGGKVPSSGIPGIRPNETGGLPPRMPPIPAQYAGPTVDKRMANMAGQVNYPAMVAGMLQR